jgi:NAD(P)-dependent dehydrogenase (short-subunit alcohol dehydrogenase family)
MMTRFATPELIKSRGGTIVYVSSIAGRRGLPYRIGYCAGKAGQVGMAYGMARELAPYNITVNVIVPGAIEGDRIDRVIAAQAKVRGISEAEMRRVLIEGAPLKRMVTADDVAAVAVFLCGPLTRSLSGQCFVVNGGEPAS